MNKSSDKSRSAENFSLQKEDLSRKNGRIVAELVFWLAIAFFFVKDILVGVVFTLITGGSFTGFAEYLAKNISDVLFAIFTIVFPILFVRIFNVYPLQLMYNLVNYLATEKGNYHINAGGNVVISASSEHKESSRGNFVNEVSISELDKLDPRQAMIVYAENSGNITRKIYTRAGVYLLVGVVIAFIGLAVFYSRSIDIPSAKDPIEHFMLLLPGFGVLFFIEFIALFFLRQYRAAMDEFRYFDAVARSRQDNIVVLKMFKESTDIVPTRDVLTNMNLYLSSGRILSGETTDIIESRRLQKDELEFLERVAVAFASYRSAPATDKGKKDDKN